MGERIVVGVDGSDGAHRAVEWAVLEAKRRDAIVEIVHVWDYPMASFAASTIAYAAVAEAAEQAAQAMLAAANDFANGIGDVQVVAWLAQGDAGRVLVDASREADLLVVGSHGRSAISSFVLGSVSRHCVHEAECPVVVIPVRCRTFATKTRARLATMAGA